MTTRDLGLFCLLGFFAGFLFLIRISIEAEKLEERVRVLESFSQRTPEKEKEE